MSPLLPSSNEYVCKFSISVFIAEEKCGENVSGRLSLTFHLVALVTCCWNIADRRDVYLSFKLLNVSRTGMLSEEEFMSIYDVVSLKWQVCTIVQS